MELQALNEGQDYFVPPRISGDRVVNILQKRKKQSVKCHSETRDWWNLIAFDPCSGPFSEINARLDIFHTAGKRSHMLYSTFACDLVGSHSPLRSKSEQILCLKSETYCVKVHVVKTMGNSSKV